MSKEFTRTLVYLVICGASFLVGYLTWASNKPREIEDYAMVGEEFYPEFNNPNEATSLEVTVFDEDEATIRSFEVEYKDGLWRIPSHHNYPADAEEQLAKTAASIIGIKREALASRLETDQARFGVIDPRLEDSSQLTGRGSRITLRKRDEILADYIIGNEYEQGGGRYYVRAPEENVTYLAHVNVELSTKFQDWIDTDLLKIDRNKLNEIRVLKYSVDPRTNRPVNQESVVIRRDKFGTPWQIEDLDADAEEVNHDAVKDLVSELVDTKILGVRPKPEGLTPSLGLTEEAARNNTLILRIEQDLKRKGYELLPLQGGGVFFMAQEGSFYAYTNEGMRYELHFGNIFTGDLNEIEIGKSGDDGDASAQASSDESSGEETQDGGEADSNVTEADAEADADGEDEKAQQSRYLFVRVTFDQSALGPEPTPPDPPQEPGPFDPNAPLAAPRPGEPSLSPQEQYEQAHKQYEADLKKYEQDKKTYDEKLASGQEKAKELSDRLGAWYYVVPAKNVEALRVSRADLVQPKGTDAANQQNRQQPGIGIPQLPDTPEQLRLPNQ